MLQVYMDGNQTVFYTDKVEYVSELVHREDAQPYHAIMVQFVPRNGPGRGLITKVPLDKVDSVVDNQEGINEMTADEKAAITLSIRVRQLRVEIENGTMDEYLSVLDTSVRWRLSRVGQAGEPRQSRA